MLIPSFFSPSLLLPKAPITLPCTGQTNAPLPVPAAGPAPLAASAASTAASVSASTWSGVFALAVAVWVVGALVTGAVGVSGRICAVALGFGAVGVATLGGGTLGAVTLGDGRAAALTLEPPLVPEVVTAGAMTF